MSLHPDGFTCCRCGQPCSYEQAALQPKQQVLWRKFTAAPGHLFSSQELCEVSGIKSTNSLYNQISRMRSILPHGRLEGYNGPGGGYVWYPSEGPPS